MSRTSTGIKACIDHVVQSLSDPIHPKYCARYYLFFLHSIQTYDDDFVHQIRPRTRHDLYSRNPVTLDDIQVDRIDLFANLNAFLTLTRSYDEMGSLATRMETCDCLSNHAQDPLVAAFHNWEWLTPEEAPSFFPDITATVVPKRTNTLSSLVTVISFVLYYSNERESAQRFTEPNRRFGWPRSYNDVYGPPANVASSVTMLCRWLTLYPSIELAAFMASTTETPDVISAYLHSATLPKSMVGLLNSAMEALSPIESTGGKLFPGTELLAITIVFKLIIAVQGIVDNVSVAYFFDDQAEPFLEVVSRIAYFEERHIYGSDMFWGSVLDRTAGSVHSKLCLPYDVEKYHPRIISASKLAKKSMLGFYVEDKTFVTARNILAVLLTTRFCDNIDCPSHWMSSEQWGRCTGCLHVHYCSKDCQTADWKSSKRSHKLVCKTLRTIRDAMRFPDHSSPQNRSLPSKLTPGKVQGVCRAEGLGTAKVRKFVTTFAEHPVVWAKLMDEYSERYEYRLE